MIRLTVAGLFFWRFRACQSWSSALVVPLRRIDVKRAAEQSGIADPNAFLGRIDELDVSSLAIKPVTLKFLISTSLRDGDFPKDHLELYEKGCRILCEEASDSRKGGGQRGRLNPDPVGAWLRKVVNGYYRYHAVPGNIDRLSVFGQRLRRLWWLILRRRNQSAVPWDRVTPISSRWIPAPRVLHPYPIARFLATHPRWEPYA